MDGISIRTAVVGDLAGVLALHAARDPGDPPAPSELEQRTWDQVLTTGGLTTYVADLQGVVVGTATMLVMPNITYACAPREFIEAVAVAGPYRRRGIASALVRRALDDAGAAGCDRVQLLSHKRHATDGAHDLYLGLGFVAEAEGFRLYLRSTQSGRP